MLVIPLLDNPAQRLSVLLNNQATTLHLYQKSTGFYADVYVLDTLIIGGRICEDRNRIVRRLYLGFDGDLMFVDTAGRDDPVTPGLGTRFKLFYLSADEVAALVTAPDS